jgi:hypothetical protein
MDAPLGFEPNFAHDEMSQFNGRVHDPVKEVIIITHIATTTGAVATR